MKDVSAIGDDADVVASGRIADLKTSPAGVARVDLDLRGLAAADADALADRVERAVAAVAGVQRAVIARVGEKPSSGHDNPLGLKKRARINAAADALSDVGAVVAVASGKGGVGKSTVAVHLARALARRGLRVGLLDADVYGPSAPTLLGLEGARPRLVEGRMEPVTATPEGPDGPSLAAMSIGILVAPDKAVAWRGPMVMGAVRQLVGDGAWGPLDVLIVDTPPGTGDVHLSLAQTGRLAGAALVTTPERLAVADLQRAAAFFAKVGAPILGVVANMAWIETNGARATPFGDDGARRAARELNAPLLAEIPLLLDLQVDGAGPSAPSLERFDALAAALVERLADAARDRA
ncbi:MAG: P-loop NTPase [Parvularculaceae bacterium]